MKRVKKCLSMLLSVALMATIMFSALPGMSLNADAATMLHKGVDVSDWQGSIDWGVAASRGIEFAIIRSYANGSDGHFNENYSNATANGISVGSYVYMYATNEDEARAEAQATLDTIGGRSLDYPLYLDVEGDVLNIDSSYLTDLMLIELNMFENAGYIPGIYTSASHISHMDMDRLGGYDYWMACYVLEEGTYYFDDCDSSYLPQYAYADTCSIWQFTSDGDGQYYGMSSSRLDMNFSYKEFGGSSTQKLDDDTKVINTCDTLNGWNGDFDASLSISDDRRQGNGSLQLTPNNPTGYEDVGIGAMARYQYSAAQNISSYEYISFNYYISQDYSSSSGALQLNFCTDNVDDGFDIYFGLDGTSAGWHTYRIRRDDIGRALDSADWSRITNLRFSWFNYSKRTDVTIKIDNIIACNTSSPSGNVLKITYSNSDPDSVGYKYVDLAMATVMTGYKLVYDVYLDTDAGGIGGIELDDKYGNYARDDGEYVDQNGLRGHPNEDISDYAYNQWYHRVVDLPDNWNGTGFAEFYAVFAFDGFTGNATAYFDNIKYVDASGNNVEFFFADGGDEYVYVGDTYVGNGDGVGVSVVSYSDEFGAKNVQNCINAINLIPAAGQITSADAGTISNARSLYNKLSDTEKGGVNNYSWLLAAEAALGALKYGAAAPSGNVLKVTYSNGDANLTAGYQFLDLALCTVYSGYKLVYDVYLDNDVGGIGGLDLDDGYNTNARDSGEFVDQNGISGHPGSDISDYAYHKWYHRVLTLPAGWDGDGFAEFFTLISFDGGFTGDATAYFDNIKFVDGNGNDVEYFFSDGGDEYVYVNSYISTEGQLSDYSDTHWDYMTASTVSLSSIPKVNDTDLQNVINLINALPEASAVSASHSTAITNARNAYNNLSSALQAAVTNYSRLTAAEAALSALSGGYVIMKDLDNLDGLIDSCGHTYSGDNGMLVVNYDGGAHGIAYVRVGSDGTDYVTSFNYKNYYQAEVLTYSQNSVDFLWSSGNEDNQREYQYMANVHADAGWSLVTVPVSSLTVPSSDCSIGIDNVNLVFFTYANDGEAANTFKFDNIALVTKSYADARTAAKNAFINAVAAVSSAADTTGINSALTRKAELEKYLNYNTKDYQQAADKLDDIRNQHGSATPSGKILKVVYNNSDTQTTYGYKYLDLASSTIYTGWKLVYDVYLCNDVAGIGGLDLEDKFGTFARDTQDEFKDQNGISGHPATDISDYAYQKWYHREVALPAGWNGDGFAEFYTLVAFDGGFTGTATAYFDNIKYVDADGNDVEFFFLDGGNEYSLDGGNYSGHGENVDITTVNYSDVFSDTPSGTKKATIKFTLDGATWNGSGKNITLRNGNNTYTSTDTGSNRVFNVDGNTTYTVYDGKASTGKTVTVGSMDVSLNLDYYTINTASLTADTRAAVTAMSDETVLSNGSVVLNGTSLKLTASSSHLHAKAGYRWSNGSTSASVTITDFSNLPTVSVTSFAYWGDVNVSSSVDTSDALIILQYSVGKTSFSDSVKEISDVDGNGRIDVTDALIVLQYSVSVINKFPVEN